MRDQERSDAHAATVVDDTRPDLSHLYSVAFSGFMLESFRANPDVFAERRVKVLGHLGETVRPIDREWPCPPHHPRSEDEVWQAEHVIAMEVRDEGCRDAVDRQAGRGESPLDTDAGI